MGFIVASDEFGNFCHCNFFYFFSLFGFDHFLFLQINMAVNNRFIDEQIFYHNRNIVTFYQSILNIIALNFVSLNFENI